MELLLDVEADLVEADLVEPDLVEPDLVEPDLAVPDLVDAVLFPSAAVLTMDEWLDEAELTFAPLDFEVDLVDFFDFAALFFTVDLFFSVDCGAAQPDVTRPRVTLSTAAVSAMGARKALV